MVRWKMEHSGAMLELVAIVGALPKEVDAPVDEGLKKSLLYEVPELKTFLRCRLL